MVVVEARQLSLLNPPLSRHRFTAESHAVTSFLFDPISRSLVLRHSDASFSLYPAISLISISSLPSPSLFLPPPISSATFFHLRLTRDPNQDSIFIASSPLLGGTAVLLRFHIFNPSTKTFCRLKLVSNHSDLRFDASKFGVVFRVSHGASVKLAGGTNVFALYSVTNSKIWVFTVKMMPGFQELKLMKSAIIECLFPVFTMSVSFGHLALGEENGVRVFQLRSLIKGRVGKNRIMNGLRKNSKGQLENNNIKVTGQKVHNLQKTLIKGMNGISLVDYPNVHAAGGKSNSASDHISQEKHNKHSDSVKSKTMKLRQDTKEYGACFFPFKVTKAENPNSVETSQESLKAVTIQALSANKFIILDSAGAVYLLVLSNLTNGFDIPHKIERLNLNIKARTLAVFSGTQNLWISDSQHTVHMLSISDSETPMDETDTNEGEDNKKTQLSVKQVIFCSEKIQEVMSLSEDAILILGQVLAFSYPIIYNGACHYRDAEFIDSLKIYCEEFFDYVMNAGGLNPKNAYFHQLIPHEHVAREGYLDFIEHRSALS